MTRLGATESGVDRRVLGIITVTSSSMFVASRLVVVVSGFRSARFACVVIATGQPAIFARAKAGHECREGCHGLRLFLAEVAGEPFVTDAMFEGR